MFETFKAFLIDLTQGERHPNTFEQNDYRLAAAALLIHAMGIDGEVLESERTLLHELLKQRFELDDAMTQKLIDVATEAEHEAIDLYRFTSTLNRALDDPGRLRLIEMMWQIAFADGRITEFEDNLIWRAADLLNVSPQDRIALRQRVRDAQPASIKSAS